MANPTRNWGEYNKKLVNRGEFYINPSFLSSWLSEINEMNSHKVGQPFLYPESMIRFLGVLHAKNFDYRALEGIMKVLSKSYFNFPVISYSQICRRVNNLKLDFKSESRDLIVAIDGSGIKVSNRGEWIRQKWKIKRGWIKVVIAGTKGGRIIDIRVGNEKLSETKSARGMLRKNKIRKVLMDGLHDIRSTFNLCAQKGIEPVIKIRKNANTKSKGSPARRKAVLEYKELGHKKWCKAKGYGFRWPLSEGIFSSVKIIFGENVRAHKKRNAYHEAKMKFWAYNQLLKAGET